MTVPGIETWLLILTVISADGGESDSFLGGEYQTRARCKQAVIMQYGHWHLLYGNRLRWRCEKVLERPPGLE